MVSVAVVVVLVAVEVRVVVVAVAVIGGCSGDKWRCATARAVEIANRCIKIHTCMLAPDHTKGNIQSYEYAYKHAYDSAHIGAASDAAARLTSRSEQLEVAPWLQTQTAPEEHTGARTLNVKARAHGGWPMFGKTHRERKTHTVSTHLMSRPGHMEAGPCLKKHTASEERTGPQRMYCQGRGTWRLAHVWKNTPRAKNADGLNAFTVKAGAHGDWPMFEKHTASEERTRSQRI